MKRVAHRPTNQSPIRRAVGLRVCWDIMRTLDVRNRWNINEQSNGCRAIDSTAKSQPTSVRFFWITLLSVAILASPGCSVFYLAKRTIKYEPRDFDITLDEAAACKQYAIWAEEAWSSYLGSAPDAPISANYEQGFREGFVDFVFAGGTGEPPPIPPRRFWRTMYRNPEGDQTIADWTAGFRVGAAAARDNGYRKRALVPAVGNNLVDLTSMHGQTTNAADPTDNAYEIIDDPQMDSNPPTPDGYLSSPVEDAGNDGTVNNKTIESENNQTTGDDNNSTELDTSEGRSGVLDFGLDSPSIRKDSKSNPFLDDPEDLNNPEESAPLEVQPNIQPFEKPNQEFLPDENLYEELFGEPSATEQEAYRRDAIPSDRVIRSEKSNSTANLVFAETPKQTIVRTEFTEPTAKPSDTISVDSNTTSNIGHNNYAEPASVNPFTAEPLESDPLEEFESDANPQSKRVGLAPPLETRSASAPSDLSSGLIPAQQHPNEVQLRHQAPVSNAVPYRRRETDRSNASNKPVRREDWLISGLNDHKKPRRNFDHMATPDALAPTEVDRIADRLVGSHLSNPPSAPLRSSSPLAALPQIVAPPQLPRQTPQTNPVRPIEPENSIALSTHSEPIQHAITSTNDVQADSSGITSGIVQSATVQSASGAANEFGQATKKSVEAVSQVEVATLAKEVSPAARQPNRLAKPATEPANETGAKIIVKSARTTKKKTNATEEWTRARNAFRGPDGVRTNYDTYSGMFQPH